MSVLVHPRRAPVVIAAVEQSMALAAVVEEEGQRVAPWEPLPHQVAPEGDWSTWLLMAGRGSGKTDAGAAYMNEHAQGPPCDPRVPGGHRMGIVAPTLGDAASACVEGVSGLQAHNPAVRMVSRIGGQWAIWPNGARAKLFSTEDKRTVERLRAGGNRCLDWWEELAAWPMLREGIDQAEMGLRMGAHPRSVVTTTPKPRAELVELKDDPDTVTTHATTDDNPHLDQRRRARLYRRYGGTQKGRQELGGELMSEAEGALWKRQWLDKWRIQCEACQIPAPEGARHMHPDFVRIVVAVDPSGGDDPENDEQGIGAAALGRDGRGYVLEDASTKDSPGGWGLEAINLYRRRRADRIVAEANFGGDMVAYTLYTIDAFAPVTIVHASRGKAVRAEPVSALYEQGRISHIGSFPLLEDELCQWTPQDPSSPNRLDWVVWAFTELFHLVPDDSPEYVNYEDRVEISPF